MVLTTLKDLGKKKATTYHNGTLSIKFHQHGVQVKPYMQERIVLSKWDVDILIMELDVWRKKEAFMEEL